MFILGVPTWYEDDPTNDMNWSKPIIRSTKNLEQNLKIDDDDIVLACQIAVLLPNPRVKHILGVRVQVSVRCAKARLLGLRRRLRRMVCPL